MLASAKICKGGGSVTETKNVSLERYLKKELAQN